MNVSIENRYKVLNQVLKLIIKLLGQYQMKKKLHVYFLWNIVQELLGFPAMGRKLLFVVK